MNPSVSALWQRYRISDPSAPVEPQAVYHFCDNQEDADGCADLVVAGRKRATATSLAELERDNIPMPMAGDYAVITGWSGEARAVIRTTSVDDNEQHNSRRDGREHDTERCEFEAQRETKHRLISGL